MNTRPVVYILVMLLFLMPVISHAQCDMSFITARAGAIPTQTADYFDSGYIWSFYPELEIGGQFFVPCLSWGITWGYWSDAIDQPRPYADFVTYSQSGHIISAQIGFRPGALDSNVPLPITFSIGIAEHFASTTYIGGTDLVGKRGISSSAQTTTGLAAVGLAVPIVAHVILEAQAIQYVPFGSATIDRVQKNRRAYTLGVGFTF